MPPGLTLNPTTGLISGTPTTSGSYTFSITAKDDNGTVGYYKDTNGYTLTVTAKSPVTGFGVTSKNPAETVMIYGIIVSTLLATGLVLRRLNSNI